MKRIICSLFVCAFAVNAALAARFTSCGPGYILTDHAKIDGVNAAECQKLWCRDLENGKAMGTGTRAASGYKMTSAPIELCDAKGNCVECFGERKWCAGEVVGTWNPQYGAYTRGLDDVAVDPDGQPIAYVSYQKGSCFGWRLEKPECPSGQTAILQGGRWECIVSSGSATASRESSIRRTGTMRRLRR